MKVLPDGNIDGRFWLQDELDVLFKLVIGKGQIEVNVYKKMRKGRLDSKQAFAMFQVVVQMEFACAQQNLPNLVIDSF